MKEPVIIGGCLHVCIMGLWIYAYTVCIVVIRKRYFSWWESNTNCNYCPPTTTIAINIMSTTEKKLKGSVIFLSSNGRWTLLTSLATTTQHIETTHFWPTSRPYHPLDLILPSYFEVLLLQFINGGGRAQLLSFCNEKWMKWKSENSSSSTWISETPSSSSPAKSKIHMAIKAMPLDLES